MTFILSALATIDFVKEHFGIEMEKQRVVCHFSSQTISALANDVRFPGRIIDQIPVCHGDNCGNQAAHYRWSLPKAK